MSMDWGNGDTVIPLEEILLKAVQELSVLDQWEAELKQAPDENTITQGYGLTPKQGLALIDLVRKKDWILEELNNESIHHPDNSLSSKWLEFKTQEALALTEKSLK